MHHAIHGRLCSMWTWSLCAQTDEGSQSRCFSRRSQSLLASVRLHGLTVTISTNHRPVRMMRAPSANPTPRIRLFFSKGAYFSCQLNYKPPFNAPDTLCNNVRRLFETLGHHVKVLVLCKQPGCVFRNVFVGSLINGGLRKPVLLQKRTLSPLDMTGILCRFERSIKE